MSDRYALDLKVRADWNALVDARDAEIGRLRVALAAIVQNASNGEWTLPSSFANYARNALLK